MTAIALVVALALLAVLAVMQILAASGLPLGHFGWGGQHRVLPRGSASPSVASVLVYAGLAALLLSRAASPAGDSTAVIVLTWVVFAFFRRERGAQRDLAQPRRTLDDGTDQPPAGSSNARHRPGRRVTMCS